MPFPVTDGHSNFIAFNQMKEPIGTITSDVRIGNDGLNFFHSVFFFFLIYNIHQN